MTKVVNNHVIVETDKVYLFPLNTLNDSILKNDEFLLSVSMKQLQEVFIYGIPDNLQEYLLKKVNLYDSSSAVNAFKFNGKEYWLDKSLRNSLFNLFNNSEDSEEYEIVFGDVAIKEKAGILKEFLKNLEKYAYKCFVVTQKHLLEICSYPQPTSSKEYIKYIDFLLNYDYTSGYPEKLEI